MIICLQSGDDRTGSQKDMVCMVCDRQFPTEQHSLLSSSSENKQRWRWSNWENELFPPVPESIHSLHLDLLSLSLPLASHSCQQSLKSWSEVKVAQSCPTLCNPMDYTVHSENTPVFSRPEYWSGKLKFPSPWDLLNQGLNPGLPHCRWFFTSWATREAQ